METLYQSKGIAKSDITKKMISIVICFVIMIGLFIFAQSEVKGKTHAIPSNGGISYVSLNEARFSEDEQKALVILGFVFGILAVVDAATIGLGRTSWVEITQSTIKGNFMGKTVSYPITDITKVSAYNNYLIISGKFGVGVLVVQNAKTARKVINELLLAR